MFTPKGTRVVWEDAETGTKVLYVPGHPSPRKLVFYMDIMGVDKPERDAMFDRWKSSSAYKRLVLGEPDAH